MCVGSICLDAAEGVPVSAWQNFVFEANTLKSCVLLTVIWKHHWFGLFQLGLRKSLFCTVKMAHCAEKAFVKREGQRIISFRVKLFLKIFLLLTFFVFCSGHKKPWKLFLRSGYAGCTNISGSYGFDIFWVFISFILCICNFWKTKIPRNFYMCKESLSCAVTVQKQLQRAGI